MFIDGQQWSFESAYNSQIYQLAADYKECKNCFCCEEITFQGKQCCLVINDSLILYCTRDGQYHKKQITLDYSYEIKEKYDRWGLYIYTPDPNIILEFQTFIDMRPWDYLLSKYLASFKLKYYFKEDIQLAPNVYQISRIADQCTFAVKIFRGISDSSCPILKEKLKLEVENLRKFDHPNIVKFEGIYTSENTRYLVMEYAEGQTLLSYLNNKKSIPWNVMRGILQALSAMEEIDVVHRDIAPKNIMVTKDGQVKIIGFGISTDINSENYLFVKCGTPGYVAPEIASIKDPAKARMTTASDVFSAGVIFYNIIYRRNLFSGSCKAQILEQTVKFDLNSPKLLQGSVQKELNFLLQRMLDPNPETRISAAAALNYFKFEVKPPH